MTHDHFFKKHPDVFHLNKNLLAPVPLSRFLFPHLWLLFSHRRRRAFPAKFRQISALPTCDGTPSFPRFNYTAWNLRFVASTTNPIRRCRGGGNNLILASMAGGGVAAVGGDARRPAVRDIA
jgi:hypothetical protein